MLKFSFVGKIVHFEVIRIQIKKLRVCLTVDIVCNQFESILYDGHLGIYELADSLSSELVCKSNYTKAQDRYNYHRGNSIFTRQIFIIHVLYTGFTSAAIR